MTIEDAEGLGGYHRTWMVDGRLVPGAYGPGAQGGNTPAGYDLTFPETSKNIHVLPGSATTSRPARPASRTSTDWGWTSP